MKLKDAISKSITGIVVRIEENGSRWLYNTAKEHRGYVMRQVPETVGADVDAVRLKPMRWTPDCQPTDFEDWYPDTEFGINASNLGGSAIPS